MKKKVEKGMAFSVPNKNVFNVYFSEGICIVRLQQINPFMPF